MSVDAALIDGSLRAWTLALECTTKKFNALTPEALEREIGVSGRL